MDNVVIYIIGLVVTAVVASVYSMYKAMGGLKAFDEGEGGWVVRHLFICLVGGASAAGFYSVSSTTQEALAICIGIGSVIWIINLGILTVIVNTTLETYIQYKRDCALVGVDINRYIDRYFVILNRSSIPHEYSVNVTKVDYNKCWLGVYATLGYSVAIGSVPKSKTELVKDIVTGYFKGKDKYLLEFNGELNKTNQDIHTITVDLS